VGDRYDIFFSYAHADKGTVDPIIAALNARNLRVFRDVTGIMSGESISRRVSEGLTNSRMLVAWYSTTYPTRRSCQWELTAAIIAAQHDASDTQAVERRIFVLNPEDGVDHIKPLHVRDQLFISSASVDPSVLADKITERLSGLKRTFSEFHRISRPHWYGSKMRLGSNRFVGRIPDLWAIHSGLSQHNFAMSGGANVSLVQVQGMGGVGKTLLAEEYALRFAAAYPGGIFWLSAVASESLSTQVLRIAGHLELVTAGLNPHEVEGLLHGTLSEIGRYLWIVDDLPSDANHDTLLEWSAPSSNGATLFTTRNKRLTGSGVVYPLDVLTQDDAFELLTSRRPPKNEIERLTAQDTHPGNVQRSGGNWPLKG
jgi:hypothetical protein